MAQWSQSQLAYAKTIVDVGRQKGATAHDIDVALLAALTESGLQNYANSNVPESLNIKHDNIGSDHASVGIFQQQVGIWGSAQELMDPATSAAKFYDALHKIPLQARNNMSSWQLAQSVQHSAFPDGSNYKAKYNDEQDLAKAVQNLGPYDAIAQGVGGGWNWITNSHNWQRIGLGAVGAVLLILAVWFIIKNTDAYKTVAKTTKSALEVAAVA